MKTRERTTILQIIPAQPGWRIFYAEDDGSASSEPLYFWALVRDRVGEGFVETMAPMAGHERSRWFEVEDATNFIGCLGPNATDAEHKGMLEFAASLAKSKKQA